MNHDDNKAGGLEHAMNKVGDVVGGLAGKAEASMTSDAPKFVENASISDTYEIEAARIALQRTRDHQITEVAQRMTDDHQENTRKLKEAVERSEKVDAGNLADDLDSRRKKMIEHLREAPENAFDKTYVDQQTMAHEEAVKLMHHFRDEGNCPVLRGFAAEASPVIEGHLNQMKRLQDRAHA